MKLYLFLFRMSEKYTFALRSFPSLLLGHRRRRFFYLCFGLRKLRHCLRPLLPQLSFAFGSWRSWERLLRFLLCFWGNWSECRKFATVSKTGKSVVRISQAEVVSPIRLEGGSPFARVRGGFAGGGTPGDRGGASIPERYVVVGFVHWYVDS